MITEALQAKPTLIEETELILNKLFIQTLVPNFTYLDHTGLLTSVPEQRQFKI